MMDNNISAPKTPSIDHLLIINGIKFSLREIDVIAYVVGGRSTKKIAMMSGLSPRTVENYIRNIMIKLECNSRESIIDFIEKSDKLSAIRAHYSRLIGHQSFSEKTESDRLNPFLENVPKSEPQQSGKRKWIYISGIVFSLMLTLIVFGVFIDKESGSARSVIILPSSQTHLIRPKILSEIQEGFKSGDGIQTVALVGIGGAGKTTLARHYATQQKRSVIWELNAETRENLQRSFTELAESLIKTNEERKFLNGLKEIKDSQERENKITQFVREHLQAQAHWLLLFDNVDKFSDIQAYYPHDATLWGKGHILLTTTDSNIRSNPYVNKAIFIEKLSHDESLSLFESIMTQGQTSYFSDSQRDEAKKFLAKIPAFPLDVTVAAYYLKATHIDYNQYLNNIGKYNERFALFQEKILKDTSDYSKTRQSIINMSVQSLFEENPEFVDLLMLVSLLDSHNIPRDLLDQYKSNILVDHFIYHLQKYSLINEDQLQPVNALSFLTIHRSIQDTCLGYITHRFAKYELHPIRESMGTTLENYARKAFKKEDIDRIKLITQHFTKFLSHEAEIPEQVKWVIGTELGRAHIYLGNNTLAKECLLKSVGKMEKLLKKDIPLLLRAKSNLGVAYRELGDYEKARELLEYTLGHYQNQPDKNVKEIAWTSAHLGKVYGSLGDLTKAKVMLEKSLNTYKHNLPENSLDRAWTSVRLAYLYNNLGDVEKARTLFEESLSLYQASLPEDHVKLAWAHVHLANIYNDLGESEKAKLFLEKSLSIYKKHFSDDHQDIAWANVHLSDVYRKLGNHKKAQELIDQSYATYVKAFDPHHPKIAWISKHLGILYKDMGQYEQARKWFEKSLSIYEKKYGMTHLRTAKIFNYLGEIYSLEKNLDLAENFLSRALMIYTKQNHPDRLKALVSLSGIYTEKSKRAAQQGDHVSSQKYNLQALQYLEKSQNSQ
jgi:tetratricopeptide (TPR) repeat protein/DNA-binding CsgD family transcriptional regulator